MAKSSIPMHICHLTVLNPAIHSRIFYKLALSQKKMGYAVSIIGQDKAAAAYQKEGVEIYPIRPFHRLHVRRLLLPFKLLVKGLKLRADVYILHSPELLWVGLFLKMICGAKLIYDVHEDYETTIRYAAHYPKWLRLPLAKMIRSLERLFVPCLAAVSYAEGCYDNVLAIDPQRKYVIRNTFSDQAAEGSVSIKPLEKPYMLFTGTIASSWGIWKSLALWKKVRQIRHTQFVLAGFTHDQQLVDDIKKWVSMNDLDADFIFIGGENYVAYVDILYLLSNCYCSMALYELTPSIQGKIPTKFYEAMAYHKPLVFSKDDFWETLNHQWKMGVAYDEKDSTQSFLDKLELYRQQNIQHQQEVFSWEADEQLMRKMLEEVGAK